MEVCSLSFCIQLFKKREFYPFNRLLVPKQERVGYKYDPVNIDVYLQLKAVNEVNLHEEYLDATVFLTFEWTDPKLTWKVSEKTKIASKLLPRQPPGSDEVIEVDNINSIRVDKDEVSWIFNSNINVVGLDTPN